jgi:hypothetical protein
MVFRGVAVVRYVGAACSSVARVPLYQTERCHTREDCDHEACRERYEIYNVLHIRSLFGGVIH